MINLKKNQLPEFLVKRYKDWKSNDYKKNQELHTKLALDGQKPKFMVISCCDSRVNPNLIFGSFVGDLFIYRNIANIVPTFNKNDTRDGIFSALEYAIKELNINHIIILGHSECGGIQYALNKFLDPNYRKDLENINLWTKSFENILKKLSNNNFDKNHLNILEQENIKLSITNLNNFLDTTKLNEFNISIHGLWHNIRNGSLYEFNKTKNDFIEI